MTAISVIHSGLCFFFLVLACMTDRSVIRLALRVHRPLEGIMTLSLSRRRYIAGRHPSKASIYVFFQGIAFFNGNCDFSIEWL